MKTGDNPPMRGQAIPVRAPYAGLARTTPARMPPTGWEWKTNVDVAHLRMNRSHPDQTVRLSSGSSVIESSGLSVKPSSLRWA